MWICKFIRGNSGAVPLNEYWTKLYIQKEFPCKIPAKQGVCQQGISREDFRREQGQPRSGFCFANAKSQAWETLRGMRFQVRPGLKSGVDDTVLNAAVFQMEFTGIERKLQSCCKEIELLPGPRLFYSWSSPDAGEGFYVNSR